MRKVMMLSVVILMMALLIGCTTDTPWRKATVTTYELVGVGVGETKSIAENLKLQGLVTDEQLLKVKDIYNKARSAYVAAGNAIKLASSAENAASRDAFLAEYDRLLGDFKGLVYQLYDLIKSFKKVSYLEVEEMVRNGGAS